jgi:hypothetical protein
VGGGHPRDLECSFCMGTDQKNREGAAELMLSCDLCGRSGGLNDVYVKRL